MTKKLLDNPKFKAFIEAFTEVTKASEKLSLNEGRKLSTEFFLPPHTVYETMEKVENVEIFGKDQNKIRLRLFTPRLSKDLPVIMYFHRGGWVFGDIDEADPVCRKLSKYLDAVVVSVDYRLCPENPFPKPLEDCYAATEWVARNATTFGWDADRLIVCGESAGGNMAAVVAMMARDNAGPSISAQLLICPVISSTIDDLAYKNSPDKYFLTKNVMQFFWSAYLQSADRTNPYTSPELAKDLSQLPPALVITAEFDPLCSEGESFADRLSAAEVKVIKKCIPQVIHGFIDLPIYEESDKILWIKDIKNELDLLKDCV